ncbi:MAG: hypothetical protein KAR55_04280 [Thermoplasmatales archaeon]|nr:hypothetical protein [Thermoplasmatales archaeon]
MRDNILKKALIIDILIFFISASGITGIGVDNISNSELTTIDDISNQIIPQGNPYFIMLSDYTDGAGDENLWAVQLRFDIDLHIVESEFDNKSLPLVTDQWVEIRINIDLNYDWMEIYYNGDLLHEKKWSAGPDNEGNGIVNISAVDLFSDSTTSVYFDDFSLEEVGRGVIWSENFDSYEDESSMHGQGGWKGWDNNSDYTAYVSSVENRSSPHSVDIKANADLVHEYFGNYSGEFVYTAWIYFPENIAPYAPNITGPDGGAVGEYYEYNFVSTDYNLDDVYYFIDWGDGNIEEWIGPYASGEEVTIGHMWSETGEYEIRAKARDILEFESEWSEPLNVIISNPPDKPTIDGPASGKTGVEYTYYAITTDPDGDQVYYWFDWGDGSNSDWIGPYDSFEMAEASHTWDTQGTYTIKAKAKDVHGAESEWATLEVTMPRNKAAVHSLFLRFLDRFPLLERLLNLF